MLGPLPLSGMFLAGVGVGLLSSAIKRAARSSAYCVSLRERPRKTGVTADCDKIEFRLFNSSSN